MKNNVFSINQFQDLVISSRKKVGSSASTLPFLEELGKRTKEGLEEDIKQIKEAFKFQDLAFSFYVTQGETICFQISGKDLYCQVTASSPVRFFVGKAELKDFLQEELGYEEVEEI